MRARRGFSLLEILLVLTLLGVLVRFGLPHYVYLRRQATARAIIGDVQVVRMAAYSFNTEHNAWPAEVGGGSAPRELETYLPDNFPFQRDSYSLDWEAWPSQASAASGATRGVVIGLAVESSDTLLVGALRAAAQAGIPYLVSGGRTTFLLTGFGGNY